MTRELIIEGQHVDLAPDTDITLEYTSNILGDIGKLNLSHSYTVRLPKTDRNARILDDPDNTGHNSSTIRRYLSARYYRKGIDLIGPARCYILKTTPDSYEVALVWNTMNELQELSQSSATLNDLRDLPILQWIHDDIEPDYTYEYDGALFARYTSGLNDQVVQVLAGAAPHPSMRFDNLLDRILAEALIYTHISEAARKRLHDVVLLAAPSHAPTLQMEIDAGTYPKNVFFQYGTAAAMLSQLWMSNYVRGWDAPGISSEGTFYLPEQSGAHFKPVKDFRLFVNMRVQTQLDLSGAYFFINSSDGKDTILLRYFTQTSAGWELEIDEDLSSHSGSQLRLGILGLPSGTPDPVALDSRYPILVLMASHKTVNTYYDNRFPIEGNLPNIKQWEFVKACAALFGLAIDINKGVLHIQTNDERLSITEALDWTAKVDITDGSPSETAYSLSGWSRRNAIAYKKDNDAHINFNPDIEIQVPDLTLSEYAVKYQLPFAASMGDQAIHYNPENETSVEDLKMEPRIFRVLENNGERQLQFMQDLYGAIAARSYYSRVQEIMANPYTIVVNIRLHELDLAQLDLTRAVYLGQYGKYYMIQKIQTSDTDLCKVELIQLP